MILNSPAVLRGPGQKLKFRLNRGKIMLNESKVTQMLQVKKQKKQKGATMIAYALVVAGVAAIAAVLFAGGTSGGGSVGDAIKTKVEASIPS